MKRSSPFNILGVLALSFSSLSMVPSTVLSQQQTPQVKHESLKQEIKEAIRTGRAFLLSQFQPESKTFADPEVPAISALAISAILGDPDRDPKAKLPSEVLSAFEYLRSQRKEDGGIYVKGLGSYNTAISLMAFLAVNDPADRDLILAARRYLISHQQDYDDPNSTDNPLDGGVGYGNSLPHSDMSNTHFAIEALYYAKQLLGDEKLPSGQGEDLNWEAAITFVSRCQNLAETNDQKWVNEASENKGGFVYYPGDSKAGEETATDGKKALRSYGSITYAGMMSLIYAGVDREDPRIKGVLEWTANNYTLEENPGMKAEGLFYYYHMLAKALSVAGIEKLKLADGSEVAWKEDLTRKLIGIQKRDGEWVNEASARWKEGDKVLVTSYVLLGLEYIYRAL